MARRMTQRSPLVPLLAAMAVFSLLPPRAAAAVPQRGKPVMQFLDAGNADAVLGANPGTYRGRSLVKAQCLEGASDLAREADIANYRTRFILPNGAKYRELQTVNFAVAAEVHEDELVMSNLGEWKCYFFKDGLEATDFSMHSDPVELKLKFPLPETTKSLQDGSTPANILIGEEGLRFTCKPETGLDSSGATFTTAYYDSIPAEDQPTHAVFESELGVTVSARGTKDRTPFTDTVPFDPASKQAVLTIPPNRLNAGLMKAKCKLRTVRDGKTVESAFTSEQSLNIANTPFVDVLAGVVRDGDKIPLRCRGPNKNEAYPAYYTGSPRAPDHFINVFGFIHQPSPGQPIWEEETAPGSGSYTTVSSDRLQYSRKTDDTPRSRSPDLVSLYPHTITGDVGEANKYINPAATNEVTLKDALVQNNKKYRCTIDVRKWIDDTAADRFEPKFESVQKIVEFGVGQFALSPPPVLLRPGPPTQLSDPFAAAASIHRVANVMRGTAASRLPGGAGLRGLSRDVTASNARRHAALRDKMVAVGADVHRGDKSKDEVCNDLLEDAATKRQIALYAKVGQILCDCLDVADTDEKKRRLSHCVEDESQVDQPTGLQTAENDAVLYRYEEKLISDLMNEARLKQEFELLTYLYREVYKPMQRERACLERTVARLRAAREVTAAGDWPTVEARLGQYAREECQYSIQQAELEERQLGVPRAVEPIRI